MNPTFSCTVLLRYNVSCANPLSVRHYSAHLMTAFRAFIAPPWRKICFYRGSLPSALLLARKVNLIQKQGLGDVEKGKENWMFHCNAPLIKREVIWCASREAVPVPRVYAKICQLGKKLVVHREITVSVELIRHSKFLRQMIYFLPSFIFLRSKMFLLFDLAGKIEDFPEIRSFQWRN